MDAIPASPATTASAAAQDAPIPFGRAGTPTVSGGGSLLIATLLLGTAFAALWLLKRRGWSADQPVRSTKPGVSVVQRLRLSPGCSAYVLRDGDDRLLVVEARNGVQVTALRSGHVSADQGEVL